MSLPAVYAVLNHPSVTKHFAGALPLWFSGEVPQDPSPPYIVWSLPGGIEPSEYVTRQSDSDRYNVQIDIYAKGILKTASIAESIRKRLYNHGEVNFIAYDYESGDGLHRAIIDVAFFINPME